MRSRASGTQDLGPESLAYRVRIEGELLEVLADHGYARVEVPTFEAFALYEARHGAAVRSQLFTFQDRREEALRPELTAGIARFVASGDLDSMGAVLRLCASGPCFRYLPAARAGLREFHQVGAELFGESAPGADLDLTRLLHDACARIGLRRYELRLGHAGLLRTLVGGVVGDATDLGQVLGQLARLHQTGLLAARPPVGWLANRAQRLRGFGERLRDLVLPGCAPGLAGACQDLEALAMQTARDPQAPATADQSAMLWAAARALYKARWLGLEGLSESACEVLDGLAALWGGRAAVRTGLVDLCGAAAGEAFDRDLGDLLAAQQPLADGVECLVAPAMLRGLGYYTGMMLEVHVPGLGEDSHVCGGGRYDDLLTSLGAPSRPACGLGFGLEALVAALQVERQEDDHVQAS